MSKCLREVELLWAYQLHSRTMTTAYLRSHQTIHARARGNYLVTPGMSKWQSRHLSLKGQSAIFLKPSQNQCTDQSTSSTVQAHTEPPQHPSRHVIHSSRAAHVRRCTARIQDHLRPLVGICSLASRALAHDWRSGADVLLFAGHRSVEDDTLAFISAFLLERVFPCSG